MGESGRSRAVLVVNPRASRVDGDRLSAVEETLGGAHELAVRMTERQGHATDLVREACTEADVVYVFGGDGVFNEALNGVDGTTPLGLLPGGGTSVLSRALGIPREPAAAARAIARGDVRRIGVGRVNGRRFGFVASLGLDAEVVRAVDRRGRSPEGRRAGDAAFVLEATAALRRRGLRLEAGMDVEGIGRSALLLGLVSDVYTYAGPRAVRIGGGSFDDGLTLVSLPGSGPRELARALAEVVAGRTPTRAEIVHDVDGATVRCDAPTPLQADGEDLGDVREVVLASERDAVAVLVPARGNAA